MLKPKLGRAEVFLREDQIDLIAEGFAKTFTIRRAAGYAKVSAYHVKKWIENGEQDLINDVDSINAQLFIKVAYRLSEKSADYIARLENCPNNAGSLTWILEKCLREDYGSESAEYKELLDLYKNLLQSYKTLSEKNYSKEINNEKENEKEMDSKSD